MSMMGTVEGGADALDQFGGWQQTSRFDDAPLAMHPLGLDGIQPRRLDRQIARDDPHPRAGQLDLAVVTADPGADLTADMPGGVVPDQQQGLFTERLKFTAAPGQVPRRERTDWAAIHKPEPGLLLPIAGGLRPADQQAVAGQGFGVGVVFRDRRFDQPQGPVRLSPGMQGRPRQARPPGLALKAERPLWMGFGQTDQTVACAFFRAYAGSGLVIQRLARFQPTPRRLRVARMVSPLTRSGVSPCSKLTWAANSSVHRLLGLLNVRGLWCSSARKCSARRASNAAWTSGDNASPAGVPPAPPC